MRSLLLPPASSSGISAVAVRPGFQQRLSTRLLPLFNPLVLAPNPLIPTKKRAIISSYRSPSSSPVYSIQIRGFKPSFAPSTVAFSSPTSPGSVSADNEVDKAKLAQVLSFSLAYSSAFSLAFPARIVISILILTQAIAELNVEWERDDHLRKWYNQSKWKDCDAIFCQVFWNLYLICRKWIRIWIHGGFRVFRTEIQVFTGCKEIGEDFKVLQEAG